jgi:HK97 family phage major capsid protein
MNLDELKKALGPLDEGLEEIKKSASEQRQTTEQIKADFDAADKAYKDWKQTKDDRDNANQKALDELIKKNGSSFVPEGTRQSFGWQLKEALTNNFESIKGVRKGHGHAFELKAIMTEATHLTGGGVRSYLEPSIKPGQAGFNFRDLCDVVTTQTGLISLPRETASTGSISRVGENVTKPNLDYTFTMTNYTADYIAGYVRISKQMLQDLPFLQSWLPRMLIRDFYKAENNQFYLDLDAVDTGVAGAAGANYAEFVINTIASLGGAGYMPNGVVGTYAKWAELMLVKGGAGSGYGAPGVIVTDPQGASRIAGIPYYPTAWVPAGKTIVGDWTYATIAVCDPLKVEFFEQDQDNVIKNLITVRVEAREVLVVEQTDAFVVA